MTGLTAYVAYVGLFKIRKLKEGKYTVYVSAASGAVGSVVAQIAKIKGCHVVGSAGSEEKVEWLLDQAKLDYAFNYKNIGENNNLSSELKKACPEGIDLYFDNVGGKHLEAAINNMKTFGRIVLCGMISQYNAATPYALPNLFLAITNRLRLHGFIVRDHYDMLNEFHSSMIKWPKLLAIRKRPSIYRKSLNILGRPTMKIAESTLILHLPDMMVLIELHQVS